MLILLTVHCTGCYENIDNTEEGEIEVELPQIVTDANLSGRLEAPDGTLLDVEFTLEIGADTYTGAHGEFYVTLEKVNKINQLITLHTSEGLVSLANIPLIPNELHTLTFNPLESVASLTTGSSSQTLSHEQVRLTFDGSKALDEEINTVTLYRLTDHLGYSGVVNNANRVVLNHLSTYLVEGDNMQGQVSAQLEISDIATGRNIGLFRLDEAIGNWTFVTDLETANTSLDIPLLGLFSIAEYAPCVIFEGDILSNDLSLVYQKIEIANPSFATSYTHYTTYGGKYLAFLEQGGQSEMILNGCESVSTETLSIMAEDAKDRTITFEDDSYKSTLVKPLVFDCAGNLDSQQYATLCKGDSKVAMQNEEKNTITICPGDQLSIETLLDDGKVFSLPWDASIQDSIIYMPTCNGFDDGYAYLNIKGEYEVYPAFSLEQIDGNTVLTADDGSLQLILRDQGKKIYDVEEVGIILEDHNFGAAGFAVDCGTSPLGCGIDYCQVTHAGEGWFRVSFGGRVWMQTLSTSVAGNYPISGNIVIKE